MNESMHLWNQVHSVRAIGIAVVVSGGYTEHVPELLCEHTE